MLKNGFVKKNVGTLTLGERLSKIRSERRITLGEVSRGTRIQMKYLEYLESGQYDRLPADVYVKGFLKSYAQYLGTDESYLVKLYERERDIHKNIKREEPQKNFYHPVKFSNLTFTPKIAIALLITLFVCLGFFYLYRELSIFISNPRLVITAPDDSSITEEKSVKVEGITEKDSQLSINNQPVLVDENGKFSEEVVLQPGLNVISIKSINRFQKESEKTISVEAKFENASDSMVIEESGEQPQEEAQNGDAENAESKIKAEVYGDTKIASIVVRADNAEVFRGQISPGEVKNFDAQEKIFVSAEKGKYVGVRINGKNFGMLSKDTKPASRTFTGE